LGGFGGGKRRDKKNIVYLKVSKGQKSVKKRVRAGREAWKETNDILSNFEHHFSLRSHTLTHPQRQPPLTAPPSHSTISTEHTWKVPSHSRIATIADATSVRVALAAPATTTDSSWLPPADVHGAVLEMGHAVMLVAGPGPWVPKARTGRMQGSQRPTTARMIMVTCR
jgi:hypothetical protein